MKLLKLSRTAKEGAKNFFRNGWLTIATVTVLTLSLYIISLTMLLSLTVDSVLVDVQDKITISAYFNPEVSDVEIEDVKNKLSEYQEIDSVEFVSKDDALNDLIVGTDGENVIADAINEIGENPLLPALVIKAVNPIFYEIITKSLQEADFADKISRLNYEQNKELIEKLTSIIGIIRKVGYVLGGIFLTIAILVTFNTIRLTIYSQKREFEIMRLVGASNLYIKVPYVVEGLLYGVFSGIMALILLVATAKLMDPVIQTAIPDNSLFVQLLNSVLLFLPIIFGSGIFLGMFSSLIAIRKYLKI